MTSITACTTACAGLCRRTSMRDTTPTVTEMVSPPIGYLCRQAGQRTGAPSGPGRASSCCDQCTASARARLAAACVAAEQRNACSGGDAARPPARANTRRAPDDGDAVLQARQRPKLQRLEPLPEGVVVDRQQRDVAVHAQRQHARQELAVVAAPLDLDLRLKSRANKLKME